MPDAPDPDFPQQARIAIRKALAEGVKATPAEMSRIVVDQIADASRASQDQRQAVIAVCRASLGDLHVLGMDLSETTIQTLRDLSRTSLMSRVDPQDVMTWVMEGIAEVAATLDRPACNAIVSAIDGEFMGAGQAFAELCEKARRKG
ncbi:MAG: hypothetical protein NTY77_04765 [Elusimicrobia bacterium]|nr:hypothetical protein [Elusimicrobiota bacterium]